MSVPAILATSAAACRTRDEGRPFRVLSDPEAADLEAIAARILPSGDSPGAREAGVIYFIDVALADLEAESLDLVREGLTELRREIRNDYGASSFVTLDEAQQIEALKAIQDTPFFGTVRYLTLAGMFSHPTYGGNRNEVGWDLIGFNQRPAPPPFGYYDAEYSEKGG